MKNFGILCVALCLTTAVAYAADDSNDWYINKPIYGFKIQGINRLKSKDIETILEAFKQKPISSLIIDDIKRRILNLENVDIVDLEDIIESPQGKDSAILVLQIEEKPVVNVINFEFKGNHNQLPGILLGTVKVKPNDIVTNSKIKEGADALKKYYSDQGYSRVIIDFETRNVEGRPNVKNVVYIIEEGTQISVEAIEFKWETAAPDAKPFASPDTLRNLLKTKAISLFNNGAFLESNLEVDKEKLDEYYRSSGFKDFVVKDIGRTFRPDTQNKKDLMTLTFVLEEGKRFVFGGYHLTGNTVFSTEELLSLTKSKVHPVVDDKNKEYADFVKIEADIENIKGKYYDQGYAFNQIESSLGEKEDEVYYDIAIKENEVAYIGDIQIKGNSKTKKDIIMRELPIKIGDVFSRLKLRLAYQALMNTSYFSNVVPDIQPMSSGLLQITFTVAEQNTIDVRVGGTLSGDDEFPLAFVGKFADKNFVGAGVIFGADLTLSANEQSLGVNYSDDWLFGDNFGGGIGLKLDHAKKEAFDSVDSSGHPGSGGFGFGSSFMDYENFNIDSQFNIGKTIRTPIGRLRFDGGLGIELNYVDFDTLNGIPQDVKLVTNNKSVDVINSLRFGVSFDNRNIYWDPSEGFYLSQTLSYFGGILGGSRDYIRTDSTAQVWIPLWNIGDGIIKTSIGFNSTLSLMWPQFFTYSGQNFSAEDRLLAINPMSMARGWSNWATMLNLPTGGAGLWNNWVELRTPIIEHQLSLDFFMDAVRLVYERENIFGPGNKGWLFTLGGGLRLALQSLPLRLYLGKRYVVDDSGTVLWQKGALFNSASSSTDGIDLILAISLN